MKTKKNIKKLIFKKETVTQLNKVKMKAVQGGEMPPVTEENCRRRLITSW